jgi:hypothetical protein
MKAMVPGMKKNLLTPVIDEGQAHDDAPDADDGLGAIGCDGRRRCDCHDVSPYPDFLRPDVLAR